MTVADVFFTIGKSHTVCEDYGMAGESDPLKDKPDTTRKFAIISDGCSSATDSDFGSRLLCRAAAQQFENNIRFRLYGQDTAVFLDAAALAAHAAGWRQDLELPYSSTDATLVAALENESRDTIVFIFGDGVVAGRRRDGTGYDYIIVECAKNAPCYPSYLMDDVRRATFREMTGGVRTVTTHYADGTTTVEEDTDWNEINPGVDAGIYHYFARETYDVVVVMSDGVQSFRRMNGCNAVSVPISEVLDQVMGFSVLTEGFVQRRLRRFTHKFCVQQGWWSEDDVSVGAIALDPPEVVE